MIYTVTLNPAMDYHVTLDHLQLGEINRATADQKSPGGKGINVSRVLRRLGHQSTALGFIGGFTGNYIRASIEEEAIKTDFIEVEGDTRINVKIKADQESEINGVSPAIFDKHVKALEKQLSQLKEGDTVVLAGSTPPTLPASIYAKWTVMLKEHGVSVYVDTSGEALREVISSKPTFLKPNHHELSEIAGVEIETIEQAIPHIKQLVGDEIDYVLVTFAGDGAVLATKEQLLYANAPKGTVRNSVGAGDSTVAGFISALAQDKSVEEAFKTAIATGSATAFSVGFADKEAIDLLKNEILVQPIKERGK
ncbi:1-phosphofructokinase [Alkalihalobacillus xiaoxiensis]|uniref:Tagatose-6-phosphate kinase n=1 Tax=Shouchella xiaoxiensis TaxID=766895 RepID=A0ABS2SPK7_9BACI|nr:1-phosphofructokinase [Shouchella xiaoxiensis]MBM7837445.1 1-phosphofructokinase [Shouchella xiaoxiensis]